MSQSIFAADSRTTVPAEVRAMVEAAPGTRLVWSVTPDGTIIVRAKTKSVLDVADVLKTPNVPRARRSQK